MALGHNPADKLDNYQLNTVTYGTASASFLAIRSLQRVAVEHKNQFPKACDIIMSSFYVDELLSGSHTIEEGKSLISQLSQVL